MRRLFFALWPDDETRAALAASSRRLLRTCRGRAVPPELYHMTLAFLGDVPHAQADRIPTVLSAPSPEFSLVLERFGSFGRRGVPRVLWAGPREIPQGLAELVDRLRAGLDDAGVDYDRRDFKPHVTLARKALKLPELEFPQPVSWPVRDFALVESISSAEGPVYKTLQNYSLD